MTGNIWAASLLALALLAMPHSPRRRLQAPRPARGRSGAVLAVTAAVLVVGAAVLVPMTTVLAFAAVVATLAGRRRRRAVRTRAAAEGRAMTGALEVLVSELRVGAHPVRAFETAAADTADPVGAALYAVAARAELGADVSAGLRAAGLRSALGAEWDRLATSWRLAAEHGLAVATLMRAAQLDIVERQRFSARVDASMAGARATATILASLPVLGIAMGELIGADPVAFLAGGGAGGWCLVVGVCLLGCGLWWADRITGRLPR